MSNYWCPTRCSLVKDERDRSPTGRFVYLAEKRVVKALGAINSVTKLSDRKNYSYTEEQVEQIIEALEGAIESLKMEFSRNARSQPKTFEFK